MAKKKRSPKKRGKEEIQFAEGLKKIAGDKLIGKITEAEKAQFDRVRYAQEQAKRNSFVLGEQIRQD